MTRPDDLRMHDMLEAIRDIRSCTASGRESFMADRTAQHAVMYCLTVIGECVSRMTATTVSKLTSLSGHRTIALRNVVVHEYWRVDLVSLWDTITDVLPALEDDLRRVLSSMDRTPEFDL